MEEKETKTEERLGKISKNLDDINNTIKEVFAKPKELDLKEHDKMGELIKFVDENFKRTSIMDISIVFPQFFIVLLFLALAFYGAVITLSPVLSSAWVPILISIGAFFAAFYSLLMASRKFVNKHLANREAKRLEPLLTDKSNEAICLLKPLVLLKMEHYWQIKLQVLYEVNKDLFTINKLTEYYYLN